MPGYNIDHTPTQSKAGEKLMYIRCKSAMKYVAIWISITKNN